MYSNKNWEEKKLEQEFLDIYKKVWVDMRYLYSQIKHERHYIRYLYAKDVMNLDGDFVECGVYKGESIAMIADFCKGTFHGFDSWEGVSRITDLDNPIYEVMNFKCNIEDAEHKVSDYSNVKLYKGWIPEKFKEVEDIKVSLLHLDLDLYDPTKESLEFFWDKMVPGGVVLCDFHDSVSMGVEKATRDFFNGVRDIEILPTGIAVIIK